MIGISSKKRLSKATQTFQDLQNDIAQTGSPPVPAIALFLPKNRLFHMNLETPIGLTDNELIQFTGQTSIRDMEGADALISKAEFDLSKAKEKLSQLSWESKITLVASYGVNLLVGFVRLVRRFSTIASTGSPIADSVIYGALSAFALTILVAVFIKPHIIISLVFLFFSAFSLGSTSYIFNHVLPIDFFHQDQERWRSILRDFPRQKAYLVSFIQSQTDLITRTRELKPKIHFAWEKRRQITLLEAENVNSMTGDEFEEFLKRVFVALGYPEVIKTKASGDQGVDLVVSDGKAKIAIQAKCYQVPVGNEAVQQVFTGMHHYGCHACAVLTNSTFTRSAFELAKSTGCRLIDGSSLRAVISGDLKLL